MTGIGHSFKNKALFDLALTHPSSNKSQNNQRLEFLGDAVLGVVIAKLLYELYPNEPEGELARRLAALVRGETLAGIGRTLGIGDKLHLAASEDKLGGRDNASNLEDAVEALIGAIYLDGGIEAAEQFILPHWTELAKTAAAPPKDAKTALQEWAQARGLPVPSYTVKSSTGPAHAPQFTIEVLLQGYAPAEAAAASKRAAEQLAAEALLRILESQA